MATCIEHACIYKLGISHSLSPKGLKGGERLEGFLVSIGVGGDDDTTEPHRGYEVNFIVTEPKFVTLPSFPLLQATNNVRSLRQTSNLTLSYNSDDFTFSQ